MEKKGRNERITIKVADMPKAFYSIPDRPSFMSVFAFIQTNRALGELSRDVISAKVRGVEEIRLASDRASALGLYGVFWAKRDGEGILSQIKNFLIEKTKERREEKSVAAIRGLPKSLVEALEKLGADFVKDITDADIVKATLSNIKRLDMNYKRERENSFSDVEKFYVMAVEGDRKTVWSPVVQKEIEEFSNRLISKLRALSEKSLPKEEMASLFHSINEGVSYEVQRPYSIYSDIMRGKSLFEAVAPSNLNSLFSFKVSEDKLAAVVSTLRKVYDPSYTPDDYAKYRFASYMDSLSTPESLSEALKNSMTPEMKQVAQKMERFFLDYGFLPYAFEVVEKAEEKGIENPFELEDEKFMEFMEEAFEVRKQPVEKEENLEEISEEEIEELGIDF